MLEIYKNTYVTIEEADEYFNEKLGADFWADLDETSKEKALVTASRQIDIQPFLGRKADPEQEMSFPRIIRGKKYDVLNRIKAAVCEQTFVDTTDNQYHLNLSHDDAFESTESAYDLKEMRRIVNNLPKEYRVPFSMHIAGFKYREIAEKLGLPIGTVKSRIFFTRQRLQEELKDFR